MDAGRGKLVLAARPCGFSISYARPYRCRVASLADQFNASFGALADIGRSPGGGYERLTWTPAYLEARTWFASEATRLGLDVETDRNGNDWAWWGESRTDVVATGSHLDTVVAGGAYDGALGVVGGFLAVELLQQRHAEPPRPIAVVAFVEEEGARFGRPTLGSRLMTGSTEAGPVRKLADRGGVTYERAMSDAGLDPALIGADPERVAALRCLVELHIEQGIGLADHEQPVGIISGIWPHGRWRLELSGAADHAGAARLGDRRDPAMALATAIRAAREQAAARGARATIGRIEVIPNTTNTVPSRVRAWLDARASSQEELESLVSDWRDEVEYEAALHEVSFVLEAESLTPAIIFDAELRRRLAESLEGLGIVPGELSTAAGHDAAVLAEHVPTAMLHVRNPTGVSHSPQEAASVEDCVRGVEALAAALEDLAWQ